jgi:hypothetical protein
MIPTKETPSVILDHDDLLSSHAQHPSKILVRTYNDDGSTKSIFIDDSMLIRDVLFVLIHKNHREPNVDYAVVEMLPDLHMGNKVLLYELFDTLIFIFRTYF